MKRGSHLLVLLVVVVFAQAKQLDTTSSGHARTSVHAYHNCHTQAPPMKNFDSKQFNGTWFMDSSDNAFYANRTCTAFQFIWHPMQFHHDNKSYDGYFTYKIRLDASREERFHCWDHCSFSRQGYLHGYESGMTPQECTFGVEETVKSGQDPCHPHYDTHWDYWVLKTDYTNYALLWLCGNGVPEAVLLARDKHGVSAAVRNKALQYLRQHGYKKNLFLCHNITC